MLKNLVAAFIVLSFLLMTDHALASHVQGHDQEARGWLQQLEDQLGELRVLADQRCPPGEVMVGIDADLTIVCTPRAGPPPPVLTGFNGPFFDLVTFLCQGVPNPAGCESDLSNLAQFPRFEVVGTAEAGSQVTPHADAVCGLSARFNFEGICERNINPNDAPFLCPFFAILFSGQTASASGDFTVPVVTEDPNTPVSVNAATAGELVSACSNSLTLP